MVLEQLGERCRDPEGRCRGGGGGGGGRPVGGSWGLEVGELLSCSRR